MKVLDRGHRYELRNLDGHPFEAPQELVFVKRVGPKYPGNEPPAHPGTTTQEVLRALVERSEYVQGQRPCDETELVIWHLKSALYLLEARAARLHGRESPELGDVLSGDGACPGCGHVGCSGCGRRYRAIMEDE